MVLEISRGAGTMAGYGLCIYWLVAVEHGDASGGSDQHWRVERMAECVDGVRSDIAASSLLLYGRRWTTKIITSKSGIRSGWKEIEREATQNRFRSLFAVKLVPAGS